MRRSSDFGVINISGLRNLAVDLPPQDVEVVGRRGAVGDLDVVLGVELQIALKAGRTVFRPLPFIAVGKQHDEADMRSHLLSPAAMKLSMTACAVFAKSPNCASHSASVLGSARL